MDILAASLVLGIIKNGGGGQMMPICPYCSHEITTLYSSLRRTLV